MKKLLLGCGGALIGSVVLILVVVIIIGLTGGFDEEDDGNASIPPHATAFVTSGVTLTVLPTAQVSPSGSKLLGGAEFAHMTAAQYVTWLREEAGLSGDQIAESLKTFHQEQATAIAWQSRFATPVPREWTIKELGECDGRERVDPNLMQDCEVALFQAQMDGVELYMQDETLRWHLENLGAIDDVIERSQEDRVISTDESAFICSVLPQWEKQLEAASDYVEGLGRDDTVAAEGDILRMRSLLYRLREPCNNGGQQPSMSPIGATRPPTRTPEPVPTPKPLPTEMLSRDSVPLGTPTPLGAEVLTVVIGQTFWEAQTEELKRDPCVVSVSTDSRGWRTVLWNIECQLNRPAGAYKAKSLELFRRDNWGGWEDTDGDCQDTRQEVLIAQSLSPVTFADKRECEVASGEWRGPYTGEEFANASDIVIDHTVPVKHAHYSGGWDWSTERRSSYFNDLPNDGHLAAFSASVPRSRESKGPDEWRPADERYWCQYAEDWIEVKAEWDLVVTEEEADALEDMLGTCEPIVHLERLEDS